MSQYTGSTSTPISLLESSPPSLLSLTMFPYFCTFDIYLFGALRTPMLTGGDDGVAWRRSDVQGGKAATSPDHTILYYKVLWQKPLQMAENHLNLPTQRPIFHPHTLLILSTSFTSSSGRYMCCIRWWPRTLSFWLQQNIPHHTSFTPSHMII